MEEVKINLPDDLFSPKRAEEAWTGKDDLSGKYDEVTVHQGHLDELKDQATSENSIPLSPQWLYAKTSESKAGLPAASGDMRPPNSLPHGGFSDSRQKDTWRLDGSHEKKEWRRNVPDVESSHRWREEERETGLLSRREHRKEGDRENEYRKHERRSDNVSIRETTGSWLSDRQHEVSGHNSGHESRRDNKWSSRWGPDDKEKDSRIDKKMDVAKDTHDEKQSLVGSNRAASESDSHDKWRPRHRQEVISGGSSVYHAASGFGLERGRWEGSNVGFSLGRGRSNFIGSLATSTHSSTGPIGAVPPNKSESMHAKSGLSAETFCYPRGKLLDIYRKQMIFSTFDTTPEGFEEVSQITQPSSIQPLAFVRPDADEGNLLEDIWKGKVTSSEVCYNTSRDRMGRINDSKTDVGDITLVEKERCILSNSSVKERTFAHSSGYGASYDKVVNSLKDSSKGECKVKVDALIDGMDTGSVIPAVSMDVCYYANGVPDCNHTECEQKFGKINVVNGDGLVKHSDASRCAKLDAINSALPFDDGTKLSDGSNSLFGPSSIQEISSMNWQYQNSSEGKLFEQEVPPEELSLFYRDPQDEIQGPFLGVDIISWLNQGFIGMDLPVCLSDAPEGTPFQPLGEVMLHLKLKSQPALVTNPGDKSEASNAIMEADTLGVDFTRLVSASGHQRSSSEFECSLDHQVQPNIFNHQDLINSHHEMSPHSNSETSLGFLSGERKNVDKFSAQDAEYVLYSGGLVSSIEKHVGMPANNLPLSRAPSGNLFLASNMEEASLTNHKSPTNNNLNPLGLLWSELEEIHHTHPLSSNISGTGDEGRMVNTVPGGDLSLFDHREEPSSSVADLSFAHDTWSSSYRRNSSSNVIQDAMVSHHLSSLEPECNYFSVEEQLLSQRFQKQQLHQQHQFSSQQHMHINGLFMEQVESQPTDQSMPDMEQLLQLQFQQQRHFRQLQEQQQLHQQLQQLHPQQLQLLQQHQHQKQQHQQLQEQLLIEQLQHKQLHDPCFGTSCVDPLMENNMFDQYLFRQRLLREFHQQSHHLPQHHDPSLEQLIQANFRHSLHHEHQNALLDVLSHRKHRQMLPLEQQLLGLEQDQLQAPQFSMVYRQPPGMEEERHVGVRSVDESGQFIRAAAGQPKAQSTGHSQFDFLHPSRMRSSSEQPSQLKQNYLLHEQMQQEFYESSSQPFERSVPLPVGTPGLSMDPVNVVAQLQGLDVQEQHGQMHSLGRTVEFPSGIRSHQQQISNQFIGSHLDGIENKWSNSNDQLTNSLIESQFNQLHLETELQKRDLKVNLPFEDKIAWTLPRNDESSRCGSVDFLHKKQVFPSPQPLGMVNGAPTSCYEIRKPSWLIPVPATDHSFDLPADKVGMGGSFWGGSRPPGAGQALQEQSVNVYMEKHANSLENRGRLAFQSSSSALDQESTTADKIEEYLYSIAAFPEIRNFSGVKEGKRGKIGGSSSKANAVSRSVLDIDTLDSGVEQARDTVMDHGEPKVNAPIRHGSFGITGGNVGFYNHGLGFDNAYSEEMITDRMQGILPKGAGNSLKHTYGSHVVSSQGVLPELASAPSIRGKNLANFPSSEEGSREPAGHPRFQILETPAFSKKDMRLPDALFIDKKSATAQEASEAPNSVDSGSGSRSSGKKKGKKGRQIDPSLLGFKIHSNRIMMGEICRPVV